MSAQTASVVVDFREDTDLPAWCAFLRERMAESPETKLLRVFEKRMGERSTTRVVTIISTIEINESGDAEGVVSDAIAHLCKEHGWKNIGGARA